MSHHVFVLGDVVDAMETLADGSVHCIVTSPPYWGLRDYGAEGQLGLEPTPQEYVDSLVRVFRETRRVLRNDGTLWLNLGDSYASGGRGGGGSYMAERREAAWQHRSVLNGWRSAPPGLKHKDLVGIPWRVALALQADGWYLRSDVIWAKPNPMPESVTDRPTRAHEYVFLLSKRRRYFYDADAIREPYSGKSNPEEVYTGKARKAYGKAGAQNPSDTKRRILESMRKGRGSNKRSVWTISVTSFADAHFATFPPDLVKPCILAGTSARGCCPECGAPYKREVVRTGHINRRETAHVPGNCGTKTDSTGWAPVNMATDNWTPTCNCNAGDPVPCTVLDPFGGSGTVSLVARELRRDSIYIDINPEYRGIAVRRCGFEGRLISADTFATRGVGRRRSMAMVDTEERARELERMGYQRVQEVEEYDRGDDRRDADGR